MLYKDGKITIEQALINADSANNLRLKIKLEGLKGDEAIDKLLEKGDKDKTDKDKAEKPKGLQIQGKQPAGGAFKKI